MKTVASSIVLFVSMISTTYCTKLINLSIQEGDVIACNQTRYPGHIHYLLATGPNTVIHLKHKRADSDIARIVEESTSDFDADEFGDECLNKGPDTQGRGRKDAVIVARIVMNDTAGKETYYDPSNCNCMDFVSFWVAKTRVLHPKLFTYNRWNLRRCRAYQIILPSCNEALLDFMLWRFGVSAHCLKYGKKPHPIDN